MKTETVKIETAYFLTKDGSEMLDSYKAWKSKSGDNADVAARRAKLLTSGLVNEKPTAIDGGAKDRVRAVFEKQDGPLTLAEITEAVNQALEKEGKTVCVEKQISSYLSFYGVDHKKRNSDEIIAGDYVKDGEGYSKKASSSKPGKGAGKTK